MPGVVRVAIVGTFAILAIGAMYYARSFVLPVILASLISLTFAPLVRWLAHKGVPAVLTAIVLVLALGGAFAATSVALSDPVSKLVTEAPDVVASVRARFAFLRAPFERLNAVGRDIDALVSGDPGSQAKSVVVLQPGLLSQAVDTLTDMGTTLGAALVLATFLLASGDVLRRKLVRVLPALNEKKRSLRVLSDIENEVSHYLLTVAAINLGLGTCVGLAMLIVGMPNPALWGVAAALLNFIPYLGPFIAISAASAVAVTVFPTLTQAVVVPIVYITVQLLESTFVTPMILGRRLELNAVAILIMLSLTSWMWGIVGTIIGVPTLVVIKVIADNFPSLAPVAEFLSAENHAVADET